MTDLPFPTRLRQLRRHKKLSQQALEDAAGLARQRVSLLERGMRPSDHDVAALVAALPSLADAPQAPVERRVGTTPLAGRPLDDGRIEFTPAPPRPLPEVLTVPEVSTFLRVGDEITRKLAAEGTLPSFRVGRFIRFRRADVEQFAAGGR